VAAAWRAVGAGVTLAAIINNAPPALEIMGVAAGAAVYGTARTRSTMSDQLGISGPPAPVEDDDPVMPSCLVIHGLGGGPYELSPLIEALKAEGVWVSAPVLPGHDGPGPVMPASRWRDWADAAEFAFDELAAQGKPVVVLGFSTGATLALYLTSRRRVASQVLLAPFLAIRYTSRVPVRPAIVLGPLARLIPNLPRRPPAVRDPKMRQWASSSDRFRTFSILATLSALELIEVVKALVPRITTPTLIIQGQLDRVVEPAGALWLHQHLASTDKTIISLPRSDHLVALDVEREQVIAATKAFVLGREHIVGTVTSRT
jgi:carboxylesterase